jgi:hypothetical protein
MNKNKLRGLFVYLAFSITNGHNPDEFLTHSSQSDFVVIEESNALKKASTIAFKISCLPRTIHDGIKWTIQRWIMSELYPAQNSIKKLIVEKFQNSHLDEARAKLAIELQAEGYIVRHLNLEKNNVQYSAILMGHKSHIENGNWVLQATGNDWPIEKVAVKFAKRFHEVEYNLLMVNGPGVGRSEGAATPKSIGDAQEVGLRFLEERVDAKKIVIGGYSLGGAAVGMAITNHNFEPQLKKRKYLVIRQMAFDRTSNIFRNYAHILYPKLNPIIKQVVIWADCEMDSVAASKKLEKIGIPECIIQAGNKTSFIHDGMIPLRATLGYRLIKEGVSGKTKIFCKIPNADHAFPFDQTLDAIRDWNQTQSDSKS